VNGTAVCLAGVLAVGGAAALASRNSQVIRKWRTWLVSAPLVAGFLWLGAPGAALLAAGLGVVGAVEYGRLARLRPADSWLLAAAAAGLPLVAWQAPGLLGRVFAGTLLAAALVPVLGGAAAAGARRAGREPRWLTDTLLRTLAELRADGWRTPSRYGGAIR
jgi:phosphatidate cytidylyltransferase